MPLNMPGNVSRPVALELIDAVFNAQPEVTQKAIEDDLARADPEGLRALLRNHTIRQEVLTLARKYNVMDYPDWESMFLKHLDLHWFCDDPRTSYFRTDASRIERMRIVGEGYLSALQYVIDLPFDRPQIVSYNICAGRHFQFYCAPTPQQVTCLLMTGHLYKKAKLVADPDGPDAPEDTPRKDLDPEHLWCLASAAQVGRTVRSYPRQGRAEFVRGGVHKHTPYRVKLDFSIVRGVEDVPSNS